MNARILELIQNPDIIQSQDLELLKSEVKKHPYLQSIRALQLIGNHHFNLDNYQRELSLTAAYTTDKKILYQLINKKKLDVVALPNDVIINEEKPVSEVINSEEIAEETSASEIEKVEFEPKETAKPVFVEGVLNRILFEGEEDFLDRETEDIDIGSTLESGKLVTRKAEKQVEVKVKDKDKVEEKKEMISQQKIEEEEIVEAPQSESFSSETIINEEKIEDEKEVIKDPSEISFHGTEEFLPEVKISTKIEKSKEVTENESFTTETIINEDKIVEEKEVIEDSSEISFHGSAEFMPDVQIKPTTTSPPKYEALKPQLSKQDEEMQRLIAEVEAKMKASKKVVAKEVEPIENADVNFSNTQEFVVESTKIEEKEDSTENANEILKEEKPQTETKIETTALETPNSSWKPMSVSAPTPDSLIAKKTVAKTEEITQSVSEKKEIPAIIETEKTEDRPVFNVSFFTPNVSAIESKKSETEEKTVEEKTDLAEKPEQSNIPVFINTWQNWLKIERKEEISEVIQPISKEEIKNTVIEKFIEKEPKISKLKDESDFVVKEKSSNISHLMTETLANLYVEQKLYSKAIKAYEILIEKHPQKEALFNDKILEIKDQRKNS